MDEQDSKDRARAMLVGIAGGIALAYAWKNHRVLGFFAGSILASVAYTAVVG
jgi:hypothetical protein